MNGIALMPRVLTTGIELYLVRQISKNTNKVVSSLILIRVLLNGIALMPCVLTTGIELYLVKWIHRRILIESYPV